MVLSEIVPFVWPLAISDFTEKALALEDKLPFG